MPPARSSPPLTREDLTFALLASALLLLLWTIRGVVILIAFALLLAYVLDPVVSTLERIPLPRRGQVPRPLAAFLVIAALVGLIGWLIVIATPLLAAEFAAFLGRLPGLLDSLLVSVRARAAAAGANPVLDRALDSLRMNTVTLLPQLAGAALKWVGANFSRVEEMAGLAVLPILAFYLLADPVRVRESMFRLLPGNMRESLMGSGPAVHRALQSYVRGQALVCCTMGIATGAMLAILGVPNAFFLGVLAGLGEVLPVVGALLTTIAIVLSGLSLDSWHGVAGLALYSLNNWLLGTFVTPRVMERYLEIHPFAVIVSVLAGARLLGPAGAILALPTAAVMQALVEDLARRRAQD
jgi:predicted PurR-regulated permease PerM